MKDKVVPVLVVGALVGGVAVMFTQGGNKSKPRSAQVDVVVPRLTSDAKAGEVLFNGNCAQCHGKSASGTDQGPPLIHPYYRPNHHADGAFYVAAARGVVAHHWHFGNMPPVETVHQADVTKIIAYVRELQRANNIY